MNVHDAVVVAFAEVSPKIGNDMPSKPQSANPADLQALGLTERESKVYLALVARTGALPAELPELCSVPRAKVYETLQRLLRLGLVVEMPAGGRKRYEAVRPDVAVEQLIKNEHLELERKRAVGERLAEQLLSVFEASRGGTNPFDYFTAMQNPAQIIRRFDELQARAKEEIVVFNKAPYVVPERVNQAEFDALARGVKYRGIYEVSETLSGPALHRIQDFVQAGEDARVHPDLAIKLAVFDRKVSLFQLIDPISPEHRTTLVVEHPGMAQAFWKCFENYWREATDLGEFLKRRAAKS